MYCDDNLSKVSRYQGNDVTDNQYTALPLLLSLSCWDVALKKRHPSEKPSG